MKLYKTNFKNGEQSKFNHNRQFSITTGSILPMNVVQISMAGFL